MQGGYGRRLMRILAAGGDAGFGARSVISRNVDRSIR